MGGGGAGEAEVGSQAGELKMMSFFEDAPVTPSCWLLDRGTQPHHFLSKLAPRGAQYLCPVFSNCSWHVSSNRVTQRNNSVPFLSFSVALGSVPRPQSICLLHFGIAPLSSQILPLIYVALVS